MAHDLRVTAEKGHLIGTTAADAEAIDQLDGEEFRCVLTQGKGRSNQQLRLYWGVCDMIADNYDADPPLDKDAVSAVLKIETGHADVCKMHDGTYRQFPRSVAFGKMQPEHFNRFMDRALTAAALKFGPALADACRRELEKLLDEAR